MFDKDGNLKNWWDQTSMAEFLNRERCLVNQYQQYTVQGHHVSHVMRIAVLRQCGKIKATQHYYDLYFIHTGSQGSNS